METEWAPDKAAIDLKKHGVRFSDTEASLFDPSALVFEMYLLRANSVLL